MPKSCIYNVDTNECKIPTNDDMNKGASVFARAFQNYPLFKKTLPNENTRIKDLETLHKILMCYGLKNGKVYTTKNMESIMITATQYGNEIDNWDMFTCGGIKIPLQLGTSFMNNQKKYEESMNALHEKVMPQKHVYLWAIGTDPLEQGKGHGKKLISQAIKDAKSENLPMYLETADPINVKIYKKMGFKLSDKIKVEDITTYGLKLNLQKR